MEQILKIIESNVNNGLVVKFAINDPNMPSDFFKVVEDKYITWKYTKFIYVGTKDIKKQFQIQERRRAVSNMFQNLPPPNADGTPLQLDTFLDKVVAQTPVDDDE